MGLVRIDWQPDVKERRKFGVAILLGFGLISVLLYIKARYSEALVCALVAAVVGGIGFSGTVLAMPFYWLWMSIAFVLGNIMSRVVLTLFYYLFFTPIAVAMRLMGRDRLRIRGQTESCWQSVSEKTSNYERQF